ncbi:MAG: type II secretion system F family protein [Actinomycetota bacterium]
MLKAAAAGLAVGFGCLILQKMPGKETIVRFVDPAQDYGRRLLRPLLRKTDERKRRREIEETLPVFLRQTASCLQASLTVRQAVSEGARAIPGPLGEELRAVNRELDSGISLDNSLDSLAKKTDLKEMTMSVAVLKAGARYGGDISNAAQSLSLLVRKRQAAKREQNVLTAQARYSSLILGALPVAFLLFFPADNGQGLGGVLSSPAGWAVVLAGLTLNAGGFLVMRRLAGSDSL